MNKIQKISLIIIILGSAFLLYQAYLLITPEKSNTEKISTEENKESSLLSFSSDDSDGDGLANSDEDKWKTDPLDPDTDNDGYLDGEEVKNGYDPTIPSPGDKIKNGNDNKIAENSSGEKTSNLTEQFLSEQVLGTNNANISNEVIFSYLDENFKDIQKTLKIPFVSNNELNLSKEEGAEAVKKYLGSSQITDSLKDLRLYDDAMNAAVNKDYSLAESAIKKIRENENNLKKLSVPMECLEVHKLKIGILINIENAFQELKALPEDPMKVLVSMKKNEALQDYARLLSEKENVLRLKYNF